MRHSRCNDVEIARIVTSHTTVSQQAEQVRIVTGQQVTQKDDQSRRKIVWTELHIESPMNPNINLEIEVTLLPSHDSNRQSIWWRSRRRSNEMSKEGDSRVYTIKSYWQVKSPPTGCLPRQAPTNLQVVDRQLCGEVHRQVYEVDQHPTGAASREQNQEVDLMVTEADFQWRLAQSSSIWVNDTYRWLPAARYILQSMWKLCIDVRQRWRAWTWSV